MSLQILTCDLETGEWWGLAAFQSVGLSNDCMQNPLNSPWFQPPLDKRTTGHKVLLALKVANQLPTIS